jgi:hypothetical protein
MTHHAAWGSNPFEILLPEALAATQPDLRIASTFLDLARRSSEAIQSVDVTGVKHLVLSNNPELRDFLTMVNGARQMDALVFQAKSMLFPSTYPGALGQLSCLIEGDLVSFAIVETSPGPRLRWEIHRIAA